MYTLIPGYDLVEWLMDRFNLDETSNGELLVHGVVGPWAWSRRRPVDSSFTERTAVNICR